MSRRRAGVILLSVLLASACTADRSADDPGREVGGQAVTQLPDSPTALVDGSGSIELALGASRALYASAPAVVLISEVDLSEIEIAETDIAETPTDPTAPAGPGPATVRLASEELPERPHDPTSRSRCAIRSGSASLIQAPAPDSEPARYLSFPGARRRENSRRCSRVRSRPVCTGAWCQAAM